MKKKKNYPISVLKELGQYVNFESKVCEIVENENLILHFVDKDSESDFYFSVINHIMYGSSARFNISFKPYNQNSVSNHSTEISCENLHKYVKEWVSILEKYESMKTIFDDPIEESFSKEFYDEFEFIENNEDIKPFTTKQILELNEYLEQLEVKLLDFNQSNNSDNIEQIQNEIEILKNNLTSKSQKWVVKKLSNIWAKIAKKGPKYIKEFLVDAKKEIPKQIIKIGFEVVTKLITE